LNDQKKGKKRDKQYSEGQESQSPDVRTGCCVVERRLATVTKKMGILCIWKGGRKNNLVGGREDQTPVQI